LIAVALLAALCQPVMRVAGHEEPDQKKHKHKNHEHAADNGQPSNAPLAALGAAPCANGFAHTFPCRNVDLASFLPLSDIGGGAGNDVWGWTDPVSGREYALMGRSTGTSIVDISDPEHPIYLGNLPTQTVASSWRDIKVYAHHAFIVSEATGHGMQVFDLQQLGKVLAPPVTFAVTTHYAGFGRAHNLAINEESGFAYAVGTNTCAAGLHMIDIRNPAAPRSAGCFSADGYTHDTQCVIYRGLDSGYYGREICFSSNEDTLTIVDVTSKSAPRQVSRTTYAGRGYTHQGWLTEDHAYFLLDDEADERNYGTNTRTFIWDVADLDAPRVTGIYTGPTPAIDHNLYIRGRFAYEANYRSGLRVLDITEIDAPRLSEVGFFDVYPVDDLPSYNGAWSTYPFFSSGIVVVSGIEQGLFVLRPTIPASSEANLSVTVADAPDPVTVGETITYTINVDNAGLASAMGVVLTDELSPDVAFVSAAASQGSCTGTATVTCSLGTLANGAAAHVTIAARATRAGLVGNTASVVATQPDPTPANNTAAASTVVETGGTIHIGDLEAQAIASGKQHWKATVAITVHDSSHNLAAGATVTGVWSEGYSGTVTCDTSAGGSCSVATGNVNRRKSQVTFTVTNIAYAAWAYQADLNHDVDGDSTGTSITAQP
jgi:choice-of-anchor B domain-containing protein